MEENQKVPTEPYKGVRDFYPEDMTVQNYIFNTWRKVAEKAGYVEYGASILESAELYRHKTSDEIVSRQMFTFMDRGDREVALRPEMTPTLARMIAARRRGLKLPLRWFSIPNVFRYEQPQRGRKREHWQLNCDLMGIADTSAEIELISLAYAIMIEFGAKESDFEIRINDRKLLNEIFDKVGGMSESTKLEVIRLLDARDKMDNFKSELEKNLTPDKADELLALIEKTGTSDILENLKKGLNENGITNVVIDVNLARGFDYYTGVIFELFDTNPDNRRSLLGGGRYDNLLENFGVEPIPTVGFGMGDVTIRDFLETHKLPLSL